MPSTYIEPIPAAIRALDHDTVDVPRRISDYLASQGFPDTTAGVSLVRDRLRIDFPNAADEAQIRTLIENWTAPPTTREVIEAEIMQGARAELLRIRNKGRANWTAQDKLQLALALQVRELQDA